MDIQPLRRWELDNGNITFTLFNNFILLKQQTNSEKVTQINAYTLFCNRATNGYSPPDMEQQFLKTILDFSEIEEIADPLLKAAMTITEIFYQSDLLSEDPIPLAYEEGYQGPDHIKFEPYGVLLYNSQNSSIDKTYLSFSRLVLAGPGLAGLSLATHNEIRLRLSTVLEKQLAGVKDLLYSEFDKKALGNESFRVANTRDSRSAVFSINHSSLEFTLVKSLEGRQVKSKSFLCLEDIKYFDFAYFTILTLGFLKKPDFEKLQALLSDNQISGNTFKVSAPAT